MKKIILNGQHTEKLASALADAQVRCTARTLDVEDVERILKTATERLGIAAAHMKGTKLTYTGAETMPKSYKYTPESTHFVAEHNGRFWVITDIRRGTCPSRVGNTDMSLSVTAAAAILAAFDRQYIR